MSWRGGGGGEGRVLMLASTTKPAGVGRGHNKSFGRAKWKGNTTLALIFCSANSAPDDDGLLMFCFR